MELSALVSFTIIFIGSITKMPIIEAPWDVGGDEKVPLNIERNEIVQVSHLFAPCRNGDLCCVLIAAMNRNFQLGSNNLRLQSNIVAVLVFF